MQLDKPVVDGFLYSATQLYLPTSYRASALVQMEVLRRAKGYRTRWYTVPDELEQSVPAFGQVEFQVQVQPGTYVWGLAFAALDGDPASIYIQITDACTETPFLSDYETGANFEINTADLLIQAPFLITPRIVGQPGLLDVELYNSSADPITCQLVILCAEPVVPPQEVLDMLMKAGVVQVY